jgi:hypothetical protein
MPLRRIILHFSQRFFTDGLTFIENPSECMRLPSLKGADLFTHPRTLLMAMDEIALLLPLRQDLRAILGYRDRMLIVCG